MAKKAFNLADFIQPSEVAAAVSKSDTTPQIELINIAQIDSNDKNFYELSNLEPLMDSIAMDGIQQPLVVMTSPEDPQRVVLLSGHRRREAVSRLVNDVETPRPDLRLVPCIRKSYSSPAMAELQLILANSTARVLTSAELGRQAERVEMLFYELKNEGYDFPGRMRDHVAAACNASASKLARLKVIRERLEPEFMSAFEAGDLSEDAAYKIAQGMDSETQQFVIDTRTANNKRLGMASALVSHMIESFDALTDRPSEACPKKTCDAIQSKRRRISLMDWGALCCGCCLNCPLRFSCDFVCDAQKAAKAAESARAADEKKRREAERAAEAKRREAEREKIVRKNNAFALRLNDLIGGDARELADLSCCIDENDIAAALSGEIDDYYFVNDFDPMDIISLASKLEVSADYILGLTDYPAPYEAIWRDASVELPIEGDYVLALDAVDDLELAVFKDGRFVSVPKGYYEIEDVEFWIPAPKLPEGRQYPND